MVGNNHKTNVRPPAPKKKILNHGQRALQELEVMTRSGPYFLVVLADMRRLLVGFSSRLNAFPRIGNPFLAV